MPEIWASPDHWDGLDRLVIKTDSSTPLHLTLHGQDKQRAFASYQLKRMPRKRLVVESGFFTIGAVGIFSPILDDLQLIHPYAWGNIWVYGREIEGIGSITKAAFDQQSERVPNV
jgi:hypothetical protein